MSDPQATPVRQQYLDIKRKYPDAILFFRLGDFYETFDEDAEIASRELDIVLTSRKVAKGVRVPMAGIPHHAVENYLSRLIDKGYHVAICEQVGDGPVRGLFPRQVVRVVTPGTLFEPELLPEAGNNYLAAVLFGEQAVGIAYVDISTGEFAATEIRVADPQMAARQELMRLRPAELLLAEGQALNGDAPGHQTELAAWRFEPLRAEERLKTHFRASTLEGFGMADRPLAIGAAGAILEYLEETQQPALRLLSSISSYSTDDFMLLDASTRRNLELTETIREGRLEGSLLGVLDESVTPLGARLIRQWISKPLLDRNRIEDRLQLVDAFSADGLLRTELRGSLKKLPDLERLANRVGAGVAQPRDLVAMRTFLRRVPEIRQLLEASESPAVTELGEQLDPCRETLERLEAALVDEPPATLSAVGVFRTGYSDRLDSLLESSRAAREWIDGLEAVERERTGIKNLKVGYNKVFGYYIEVTKANAGRVPEGYQRKQTLVNAERYTTPEMKDYESQVLSAEEGIREIEADLFRDLCDQISEQSDRLLRTARAIGRLDVVAGLAEVAIQRRYTRPVLTDDVGLEIHDGRHPVVEFYLRDGRFVPNDSIFEEGERVRIITGPNMSGKSTYLRQVALIVLMAQMGSFVPAASCRIGLADRIFTRIGAQDEIHAGQSTFMVEMVETAHLLHNATERSLLILDEIGRGTSTYDGLSIAWAVVEHIHTVPRLRARTLFATHFHELTGLADRLPGVRNYNIAVSEEGGEVVFLHTIVPGGADRSYGIHVAELAGLPRPVLQRASEILALLEDEAAGGPQRSRAEPSARQLPLFGEWEAFVAELEALDLDALSPLEALNRLYEMRKRVVGRGEKR